MSFSHWYGYGGQNLVLENKSLDPFKEPHEDEEDTDVLDPGELDSFPEAGSIGGGNVKEEKIIKVHSKLKSWIFDLH